MENKENVYNKLKKVINQPDYDLGDYMNLVAVAMEITEKIVSGTGAAKKVIVMAVVNDIVTESNSDLMKKILTPPTISNLIEVIIKANKGFYIINKVKRRFCCL